jgi:hypothetical protein
MASGHCLGIAAKWKSVSSGLPPISTPSQQHLYCDKDDNKLIIAQNKLITNMLNCHEIIPKRISHLQLFASTLVVFERACMAFPGGN